VRSRTRRTLSVSERVVESATNLKSYVVVTLWHLMRRHLFPIISRLFMLLLLALRILGEIILRVLDWRLLPGALALKDISATAQQVDIRIQQFCYWPIQYMTLRSRKQTWKSVTTSHPEYIRFYNSLWLVANDIIIGIAIGIFIMENASFVAAQVDRVLVNWAINGLQRTIVWLMGWPAGLKLNTELATFLGDLFLWVIDYWAEYMATFRPHLPGLIYLIGYTSFAGATMPIALFSDLISILTVHVHCFYVASAKIYNWQLSILSSLFHLFRGKKHNVLRNRIDSCDYDLDQLLLGTILFAILAFLLPTVMVFYITFAGARMAIITVKACLEVWLAILNHFPLFALMLRVKDSKRLPGGIRFELVDGQESPSVFARFLSLLGDVGRFREPGQPQQQQQQQQPQQQQQQRLQHQPHNQLHQRQHPQRIRPSLDGSTAYIRLQSVPLPLSHTFHSYLYLFSRLRAHYVSVGVTFCLLTGRFVPPIHRRNLYGLQYSMLPVQRVGVKELWKRLWIEVARGRDEDEDGRGGDSSKPSSADRGVRGIHGRRGGRKLGMRSGVSNSHADPAPTIRYVAHGVQNNKRR